MMVYKVVENISAWNAGLGLLDTDWSKITPTFLECKHIGFDLIETMEGVAVLYAAEVDSFFYVQWGSL